MRRWGPVHPVIQIRTDPGWFAPRLEEDLLSHPVSGPGPAGGLIFDLFHTLTPAPSRVELPAHTSTLLGIPRARWEQALFSETRARLTGQVREPLAILHDITDRIDAGFSDQQLTAVALERARRFEVMLTAIPAETLDSLAELRRRGWSLALLSNADAMEAAPWPRSPLAPLFHRALFSCDIGCAKPEPESYRLALDALELPAERCWFLGDGGSNELLGAREAGLRTILVSEVLEELWPERLSVRRRQADFQVRRLAELLQPGSPLG